MHIVFTWDAALYLYLISVNAYNRTKTQKIKVLRNGKGVVGGKKLSFYTFSILSRDLVMQKTASAYSSTPVPVEISIISK